MNKKYIVVLFFGAAALIAISHALVFLPYTIDDAYQAVEKPVLCPIFCDLSRCGMRGTEGDLLKDYVRIPVDFLRDDTR